MKLYFLILCVAILLNVCNNHLIHLVLSIHNINLYNSLPCNGIIRKNQYIAASLSFYKEGRKAKTDLILVMQFIFRLFSSSVKQFNQIYFLRENHTF